jgi:hypothetical protein
VVFPGSRSYVEWQEFSASLYQKWGDNWANQQKPHLRKGK